MIRRFCDACGVELNDGENYAKAPELLSAERTFRPRHGGGPVSVVATVSVAINGNHNGGDICRCCVIDTVNSAETRDSVIEAK